MESIDILQKCKKLLTEETIIQIRLGDQNIETQQAALRFTNIVIHRMNENKIELDSNILNKLRQIILNSIIRQKRCEGKDQRTYNQNLE